MPRESISLLTFLHLMHQFSINYIIFVTKIIIYEIININFFYKLLKGKLNRNLVSHVYEKRKELVSFPFLFMNQTRSKINNHNHRVVFKDVNPIWQKKKTKRCDPL